MKAVAGSGHQVGHVFRGRAPRLRPSQGRGRVHRLVRLYIQRGQPRQTSFALVEVLPEFDDSVSIEIKPDDLRIDTFMERRQGRTIGQHHVFGRTHRALADQDYGFVPKRTLAATEQGKAMKILKAKLLQLKEQEMLKEKQELRGEYHTAAWGQPNPVVCASAIPHGQGFAHELRDIGYGRRVGRGLGRVRGSELRQQVKPGDFREEADRE